MIFLVLSITLPYSPSYSQINTDSLISFYSERIRQYLDKDSSSVNIIQLTSEGIAIYTAETDSSKRKFDFSIYWNEINVFKELSERFDTKALSAICSKKKSSPFALNLLNLTPRTPKEEYSADDKKPLRGYKIALDPGHIAGDIATAKMEKKWIDMKNPDVKIIEGELTLATAKILERKLTDAGAEVMLTRTQPNTSSFGLNYKKWKDSLYAQSLDTALAQQLVSLNDYNFLKNKASDLEIFRQFFLAEDNRERARKINAYSPDLTLIIHYNVDEENTNWITPTTKDFNMVFTGGSFMQGELQRMEDRLDFLRLLLTDDLEKSAYFSNYIANNLQEITRVPLARDSDAIYLYNNCLPTNYNGVYCRNLMLTRKIKNTLCYGESLYQDNRKECILLSKSNYLEGKVKTSKRVAEVAEAYYEGIINYIKPKNLSAK